MTTPITFRADDETAENIDDLAADADVSRSKLLHALVTTGLEHHEETPEWLQNEERARRRIKEHKKERRTGYFRSNFASEVKSAFSDNLNPDEFEAAVSGYIAEAHDLDADDDLDGIPGTDTTFTEYVEEQLARYRIAYEMQSFDHDHAGNPLGGFSGLDEATRETDNLVALGEQMREAMREKGGSSTGMEYVAQRSHRDRAKELLRQGRAPEGCEDVSDVLGLAKQLHRSLSDDDRDALDAAGAQYDELPTDADTPNDDE